MTSTHLQATLKPINKDRYFLVNNHNKNMSRLPNVSAIPKLKVTTSKRVINRGSKAKTHFSKQFLFNLVNLIQITIFLGLRHPIDD